FSAAFFAARSESNVASIRPSPVNEEVERRAVCRLSDGCAIVAFDRSKERRVRAVLPPDFLVADVALCGDVSAKSLNDALLLGSHWASERLWGKRAAWLHWSEIVGRANCPFRFNTREKIDALPFVLL